GGGDEVRGSGHGPGHARLDAGVGGFVRVPVGHGERHVVADGYAEAVGEGGAQGDLAVAGQLPGLEMRIWARGADEAPVGAGSETDLAADGGLRVRPGR